MADFDRAVAIVLREECGPDPEATGLVDDPNDPGGVTKYGISQTAHPGLDIRALSRDQAIEIYRSEYWTPVLHAELAWPLQLTVFDFAVTAGVRQALVTLQATLGVQQDGLWGPHTATAADRSRTSARLLFETTRNFNVRRCWFYIELAMDLGGPLGLRRQVQWCGRVASVALASGFLPELS